MGNSFDCCQAQKEVVENDSQDDTFKEIISQALEKKMTEQSLKLNHKIDHDIFPSLHTDDLNGDFTESFVEYSTLKRTFFDQDEFLEDPLRDDSLDEDCGMKINVMRKKKKLSKNLTISAQKRKMAKRMQLFTWKESQIM